MTINIEKFGEIDGAPIWCATLQSDAVKLQIINFGATTKSIQFQGNDLILGYDALQGYLGDTNHMGVIAGRVANRTAFGRFSHAGKTYQLEINNGDHHLHGGPHGFGRRIWDLEADSKNNAVLLRLRSEHMDAGYPAAVNVALHISLHGKTVEYAFHAIPDGETPINLAQHNYYNLGGSIADHQLMLNTDGFCEVDNTLIPTGKIIPVTKSPDDTLCDVPLANLDLDHNFTLLKNKKPVAVLRGRFAQMTMETDQLGIQVYTGQGLDMPFAPSAGMCLEPQYFPDCLNQPNFQSCIHSPDLPYSQKTTLTFAQPQ